MQSSERKASEVSYTYSRNYHGKGMMKYLNVNILTIYIIDMKRFTHERMV